MEWIIKNRPQITVEHNTITRTQKKKALGTMLRAFFSYRWRDFRTEIINRGLLIVILAEGKNWARHLPSEPKNTGTTGYYSTAVF